MKEDMDLGLTNQEQYTGYRELWSGFVIATNVMSRRAKVEK